MRISDLPVHQKHVSENLWRRLFLGGWKITLPKTNSPPLKMVFSGANCCFRECIWLEFLPEHFWITAAKWQCTLSKTMANYKFPGKKCVLFRASVGSAATPANGRTLGPKCSERKNQAGNLVQPFEERQRTEKLQPPKSWTTNIAWNKSTKWMSRLVIFQAMLEFQALILVGYRSLDFWTSPRRICCSKRGGSSGWNTNF